MRPWLAFCCSVAVVAASGCSSASRDAAAGSHLPNGVRVPKGASVVGVAAPTILPGASVADPTGDRLLGWTALLTITGDPVKIY